MNWRTLPRTVIMLGLVSFWTDLSSEMILPLLPTFLTGTLGAGALALGWIEGVAETTAALVKIASGRLADRVRNRKGLVLAGYGLSGLCRPLIGLAGSWVAVLLLRFGDRVGKGIRTAPRDALIADVTPVDRRGEAFGFHRGMDHAGATVGPLVAMALLSIAGLDVRTVFLLAAVPAVVVMGLIVLGVSETDRVLDPAVERAESARHAHGALPVLGPAQELGPGFHRLLWAEILFTLGNASDTFILLRLAGVGFTPGAIAGWWALHHVVKMAANFAGGRLSDRLGRKPMMCAGWALYAILYGALALATDGTTLVLLFLAYGLFYGFTEPAERAWVADVVGSANRGTAFGWLSGAVGLAALPANLLCGYLYTTRGPAAAFLTGSGFAAVALVVLTTVSSRPHTPRGQPA